MWELDALPPRRSTGPSAERSGAGAGSPAAVVVLALQQRAGNRAVAAALARRRSLQRKIIKGNDAPSHPTPLEAFEQYVTVHALELGPRKLDPGTRRAHPRAAEVQRPKRVEATVDKGDLREDERTKSSFTTQVGAMAKVEQFLTTGAAHTGDWHGGHLIAHVLAARDEPDQFFNAAPQFGSFNIGDYERTESYILSEVRRNKKKFTVTAKVDYQPDVTRIPLAHLKNLGIVTGPAKDAGDLTFHTRTPKFWWLRAVEGPPPKHSKKEQHQKKEQHKKGAWKLDDKLSPTIGDGYASVTYDDSEWPFLERLESRQTVRGHKKRKGIKLRSRQWTPTPTEPSEADVLSLIKKRLPAFAESWQNRSAAADRLEAELNELKMRSQLQSLILGQRKMVMNGLEEEDKADTAEWILDVLAEVNEERLEKALFVADDFLSFARSVHPLNTASNSAAATDTSDSDADDEEYPPGSHEPDSEEISDDAESASDD